MLPSASPLQVTSCPLVANAVKTAGSIIFVLSTAVQPLPSVIVIEIFPCANPVAVLVPVTSPDSVWPLDQE